jgi:hypothetical protein
MAAKKNYVKSAVLKQIKELNGNDCYKAFPAIFLDFLLKRLDIDENCTKIYLINQILEGEDLSAGERQVLKEHLNLLRLRGVELRKPFDPRIKAATEIRDGCALQPAVEDRWLLRDENVEAAEKQFEETWKKISTSVL